MNNLKIKKKKVKLKRACVFKYGESLPSEKRVEGEIPIFGSNGIVGFHSVGITDGPSLIIGRKGSFGKINYSETTCFPIDTTFYIDNTCTNNHLRWLYYTLSVLGLDSYSKDSAVPGLSREDAYEKEILLPSFEQQKKIVSFLDQKCAMIDALIEKKQNLVELKKEERTALINQAVSKGLDPNVPMKDSGIEWLGEIPEYWEVKKLKYCIELIMGQSPKSEHYNFEGDGIPFLQGNADFGKIHPIPKVWTRHANKICLKDDIFLSVRAPVGELNIADQSYGIGRGLCALRPFAINRVFFFYLLIGLKEKLIKLATGSTFTAVSVEDISNLMLPNPPIEEQKLIIELLEKQVKNSMQLSQQLTEQIELLKEYKTTLISEAVTGKIIYA